MRKFREILPLVATLLTTDISIGRDNNSVDKQAGSISHNVQDKIQQVIPRNDLSTEQPPANFDKVNLPISLQLPRKIEIQGTDLFIDSTEKALKLLEKSPSFIAIKAYLGIIKEGERSGMLAYSNPPTFEVNRRTWKTESTWYASQIAHDAYHSFLYHKYVEAHPMYAVPPDDVWTGKEAERKCLEFQKKSSDRDI